VLIPLLIILSFTIGYYVKAQTELSYETVIENGSMVETASYVVFEDGSTYYAKNGTTGAIDYSGTNALTVAQNALNDMIYGGTLFFKQGTYTFSSYLLIPANNIKIKLDAGAILYSSNTANGYTQNEGGTAYCVIVVDHKDYFSLEGGFIDGNGANDLFTGVLLIHTNYASIKDLMIYNIREGTGIYFDSENKKFNVENCIVQGMTSGEYEGNAGFDNFNNSNAEATYSNCKVFGYYNMKYGFLISSSSEISVSQPQITAVVNNGIWLDYNTDSIPANRQPSDIDIKGGFIYSVSAYHGIRITNGANNRIIGVRIKDIQTVSSYAILEDGGSSAYNIIEDNDVSGNSLTTVIYITASTTIVRNNAGFKTENWGVAHIHYGETFNHGLAKNPTVVLLTTTGDGTIAVVAGKTDSIVTVGLYNTTDGEPVYTSEDIYWYAYYHP
jgi:hypothetical protein